MPGTDLFEHWSDQLYYDEVGRYAILTPAEERRLLREYHTCPSCKKSWPRYIKTRNCTRCGTIMPDNLTGQTHTCTTCFAKVPTKRIPKSCPFCGSQRNLAPRQQLIEGNLRFVIRTAKRFTQNPEHVRKLVSAGNVGLVMAVDRFDITKKARFLTYAAWWIRKEMLDEMSSSSSPVHVPTYLQKKIRKIDKEGRYKCVHCGLRSQNKHGHDVVDPCTELEHEFRLPVTDSAAMLNNPIPLDSLDLKDEVDVFRGVLEHYNATYLRDVFASLQLSPRDYYILVGFFNVPAGERKGAPKKLPQLAAVTRVTTERVRQIKENALAKLRAELERRAIPEISDVF